MLTGVDEVLFGLGGENLDLLDFGSFRFLCVGDAVVGRGNAGWTTSKSVHPCPCQKCLQGPPTENIGRGYLLNRPSCPPDDPIGHGTELN